MNYKIAPVLISLTLLVSAPIGCAHHTRVYTEERVDTPRYSYSGEPVEGSVVVHEEPGTVVHEKVVEEDEHEHHGVFHILGDIIALPFRAVGALLTAIF